GNSFEDENDENSRIEKKIKENSQESDEEVEESDSEIDELGNEVDQIENGEDDSFGTVVSKQNMLVGENNPPLDSHVISVQPQLLETFDRGLARRQSKGKYQAKKYIMTYPKPIDDSGDDIPGSIGKKITKRWLKTQDPDG
ncbi:unnamed protein product, partial [Thelazia callipaeda]|uniref:DDX42 n=1 Tax=Thelazia callipaeda TaxID=103827 RepID=A0A0N5D7Q5_THECL